MLNFPFERKHNDIQELVGLRVSVRIDYAKPFWQRPWPVIKSAEHDVDERQGDSIEHQRAALALKGSFTEKGFGFSLALFEHVHSHRNVYHAIVGRQSGTVVMTELRVVLADLVRNDLKILPSGQHSSDLPRNAVIHFVVGSLMSVMT